MVRIRYCYTDAIYPELTAISDRYDNPWRSLYRRVSQADTRPSEVTDRPTPVQVRSLTPAGNELRVQSGWDELPSAERGAARCTGKKSLSAESGR